MDKDSIDILGVKVHPLFMDDLNNEIKQIIQNDQHSLVLNVNVNCLNLTFKNEWMRDLLNNADIVFCDGQGVKLGAKILGEDIPERITYADWMYQLVQMAESEEFTLYFLGAKPGVADMAAAILKEIYPNLIVVGTHHGYFDKVHGSADNESVIKKINSLRPNILILGFGMPTQERWLMENWDRIDTNVALTGGAVFDYVSGELKRAPSWMTDNGLEWLGRIVIEPRRLWRRYLIGNPVFIWRVFLQRFGLLKV